MRGYAVQDPVDGLFICPREDRSATGGRLWRWLTLEDVLPMTAAEAVAWLLEATDLGKPNEAATWASSGRLRVVELP